MLPPLDSYANLMSFIVNWETGQAAFIGEWLYEHLKPETVIDFGCGPGNYLLPFQGHGCTVLGLDADPHAGQLLDGFWRVDLRLPLNFGKWDLLLCIETAEHIQIEYVRALMRNISQTAPTVFFSAAHPGQGGQYHYNEQNPDWWEIQFAACGYGLHPLNAEMRAAIAANAECQKVQWLIPNARLFQRQAA